MDEVKSHRHDRHSEDDVGSGGNDLEVICGCPKVVTAWYEVAEAYSRDGDEAVVGRRQPVPAFPDSEQHRTHKDVASDQTHRHRQWNAHPFIFFFFVVVVIILDYNMQQSTDQRSESSQAER